MDNFTKSELVGRKAFSEFMSQTKSSCGIYFTPKKFEVYDAVVNEHTEVEIKVREYYTEQYATLVMNIEKYRNMMSFIYNKTYKNGYYVCFVKDGSTNIKYLYAWSLKQIYYGLKDNTYKTEWKWAPKTTAVNSEYVWKE